MSEQNDNANRREGEVPSISVQGARIVPPVTLDKTMYMVNSDSTTVGEVQAWSEEMGRLSVVQEGADVVAEMEAKMATGIGDLIAGRDAKDVLKEVMVLGQKHQLQMNRVEGVSVHYATVMRIQRARYFKTVVQPVWNKVHKGTGSVFTKYLEQNLRDQSWRSLYNDMRMASVKNVEAHAELGMDRLLRIVKVVGKTENGAAKLGVDDPIGDFRQNNGIIRTSTGDRKLATLKRDVDAAINTQMLKNVGVEGIDEKVKAFTRKHGSFKAAHVGYLAKVRGDAEALDRRAQALIESPEGLPPRGERSTAEINKARLEGIRGIVEKVLSEAERREGLTPEMVQTVIDQLLALKEALTTPNNQ